jgi:hypothetical protein
MKKSGKPLSLYRAFATPLRPRRSVEEEFPIRAATRTAATELAFAYVIQILRWQDFDLRVVGA